MPEPKKEQVNKGRKTKISCQCLNGAKSRVFSSLRNAPHALAVKELKSFSEDFSGSSERRENLRFCLKLLSNLFVQASGGAGNTKPLAQPTNGPDQWIEEEIDGADI